MCSGLFIRKHFQWCSENSSAFTTAEAKGGGFWCHSDAFKCVLSCSVMSRSLQILWVMTQNGPIRAARGQESQAGNILPLCQTTTHHRCLSFMGDPLTPESSSDDSARALLAIQCRLEKVLALGDISLLQPLASCPLPPPPGPLCLLLSPPIPSPFWAS